MDEAPYVAKTLDEVRQVPEKRIRQIEREAPGRQRLGICLSGGGIRAATFAMGALQALQSMGSGNPRLAQDCQDEPRRPRDKARPLSETDYLAAVSGGGYMGGAYEMIRSHGMFTEATPPEPGPLAEGSPEELYIRNRSSFLYPTIREASRLILHLLIGLAINAIVVGLLLFTVVRPIGWVLSYMTPNLLRPQLFETTENGEQIVVEVTRFVLTVPVAAQVAVGLPLLVAVGVALLSLTRQVRDDRSQYENALLTVESMGLVTLVALTAFVIVPFAVWVFYDLVPAAFRNVLRLQEFFSEEGPGGEILALFTGAGAFAFLTTAAQRQLRTVTVSWWTRIAAFVVVPFIALWVIATMAHGAIVAAPIGEGFFSSADFVRWLGVVGAGALAFLVFDQSSWSMHFFYRRRLAETFAVQRQRAQVVADAVRDAGRDQTTTTAAEIPLEPPIDFVAGAPATILCAAANITEPAAAAPGLFATPFHFGFETIGSPHPDIGMTEAAVYRRRLEGTRGRDAVTVPTAMAISGAAISPAMGKQSNRWLTGFLALANIRLGVWVPHPRWMRALNTDAGDDVRWFERPRLSYLLKEILGIHSKEDRYLYVTDGGHYDNLGLVELLQRGCTEIYVVDASGEEPGSFETIGEAMALARAEFGVRFELCLDDLRGDEEELAKRYDEKRLMLPWRRRTAEARGGVPLNQPYVWGRFWLPAEEEDEAVGEIEGIVCYIRAAVTDDTPWQVKAYWESDPRFPNHSTSTQNFNHEEFEAYRALGHWATLSAMLTR